jgi:arsenate reductase
MAEALLNVLGGGRFKAWSAGSFPAGAVQPIAAELARAAGYHEPLRSKSWDEFARADAPPIDVVITVCDAAAGEPCPVWPGRPATAHWGMPDPAAVAGPADARRRAFQAAWILLRRRIEAMLALPLDTFDRAAMQQALQAIGHRDAGDER